MNAPVVAIASASAATVAQSRPFVQLNSVSLSFGGPNGLLALDRVSIDVPRPRTIANSFEPHFVDIVDELRDKIMQARA